MKSIYENTIDAVINRVDDMDEAHYEKWATAFANNQPVLTGWLFGDTFDGLTDDERGYLEYLALIIWMSVTEENGPVPRVEEDLVGEWEERNCSIMEAAKGGDFRNKLNVFFDGYQQEDLLAFVEDALLEEDDNSDLVTKEGRELMFIALRTVIDVLTLGDDASDEFL